MDPNDNLPDFAGIADHLHDTLLQQNNQTTTSINNLVAQVQLLTAEVQQLRTDVQQTKTEVQQTKTEVQNNNNGINGLYNIIDLNVGMNGLAHRLSAMDINNIIRLTNSKVHGPDAKLQPLYSLHNNTPIQNFPQTVGIIQSLPNQELNRILEELQLPNEGEEEVKRQRLIQASGVITWQLPSLL